VDKIYPGNVKAVDDLCLEIEDKEFLVLVGPSGCGKSSTLRMLAGLEDVTQGDVFIGNRRVNDLPLKDRDIAMVFQNYALYPHMSVYENMAFGLKMRKTPKAEIKARVLDAAQRLEIEHLLNRKPKALSGGERQRVALGRAMVRKPAVFLLDEPLSNLDAKLRASMRVELIKLHQRLETTFVYVTHDQTEAMTMGSRIAVMKDGVLQQLDTPQRIYDRPANEFVAQFIGTPPMNMLEGNLFATGAGLVVRVGTDEWALGADAQDTYRQYIGKKVWLGVRAEDIRLGGNGTAKASVEVVETLGNEQIIYMRYQNSPITVRVGRSESAPLGEDVSIHFSDDSLHLFNCETGKRFS
jgi:multiple sugar transport system ATP-binding protein